MTYERGALLEYQITWQTGHIETIRAHQVILPQPRSIFAAESQPDDHRVMFHGEIDGHWQLLLTADEREIRSIRNVTHAPEEIQ